MLNPTKTSKEFNKTTYTSKMKTEFIALVLLVQQTVYVLTQEQIECSDEPICRCTKTTTGTIKADCSSGNLKRTPIFTRNVSYVDLSSNKISVFPYRGELPSIVTYLDMSYNEIGKFTGNPFRSLQFLEYLDLSGNHLNYKQSVYTEDICKNLKRLKTLNLKFNNVNVTASEYPSAWSQLKSLETLKIDGRNNAHFDENFKNLTRLRVLDLSGRGCNLLRLNNRSFENTQHLTHLKLSKCDIKCIEKGSLISLKNLTYFNISFNRHLTFHVFANLSHDLAFTDIKILDTSAIHCMFGVGTILFTDDIIAFKNTTLKELYIDSNRISVLDDTVLENAPRSLEIIYMRDNIFNFGEYVLQMNRLKNVRKIYGSFQRTTPTDFVPGNQHLCNDWRGPKSTTPCNQGNVAQLRELRTKDNKMKQYQRESEKYKSWENNQGYGKDSNPLSFCFPLPPKLTEFDISQGNFRFSVTALTLCPDNSLETVYLQENNIKELIGPLYNFQKLKVIDISNNICSNISNDFFDGLPSLQYLKATHNLIGNTLRNHQSENLSKNLSHFERLDLSFNRISEIPNKLFFNQTKLVCLNLSYNVLGYLKVNLRHMKNLKYLDLSYNQISEVERSERNDLEEIWKTSKVSVNLTANALLCNCETREFLEWVNEHRFMFHNIENYGCILINNSRASFADLHSELLPHLRRECSNFRSILLGTTSAIFFCVFVIVSTIIYRFRWKLRYLYYMTKSRYFGYATPSKARHDQSYEYDAFISYDNEDKDVIVLFTQKLENEHNYRLCIHERDFLGGVPIADNITTAINKSRKTIAIVSKMYLKSYWCMFEFNMARMESIYSREGANVLLLVLYEDIAARDLPLNMLDLVNSNTYLEYPRNNDEGRAVFWDKLITAVTI